MPTDIHYKQVITPKEYSIYLMSLKEKKRFPTSAEKEQILERLAKSKTEKGWVVSEISKLLGVSLCTSYRLIGKFPDFANFKALPLQKQEQYGKILALGILGHQMELTLGRGNHQIQNVNLIAV